jgi:Family of unknown function (DUF6455)
MRRNTPGDDGLGRIHLDMCPSPRTAELEIEANEWKMAEAFFNALPHRMTEVISRTRVDLAALTAPSGRAGLLAAARSCCGCRSTRQCDVWIGNHADGDGSAAPAFCPMMREIGAALAHTPPSTVVSHPMRQRTGFVL